MKIIDLLDQMNSVEVGYFEIRKNERVLFYNCVEYAMSDYYLGNDMVYESTKEDIEDHNNSMKLLEYDFLYFRVENIETYENGKLVKAKKIIIFVKRGDFKK